MRWRAQSRLHAWVLAVSVGAGCKRAMLAASVLCWRQACHGGCERGCWLQPWVLAASVSASWKRRCWLQAWVLPASVGAACKRGCCLQTWMLPASVGWLHAWVLTASVGAGCERGCWLQARVLAASVGAGCKRGASAFSLSVLLGRKIFSHIRLPILT